MSNELGTQEIRKGSSTTLPTEAGFYWWRAAEDKQWRMVQILEVGRFLLAYDVELGAFGGRRLVHWKDCAAIGEWLRVEKPKADS